MIVELFDIKRYPIKDMKTGYKCFGTNQKICSVSLSVEFINGQDWLVIKRYIKTED